MSTNKLELKQKNKLGLHVETGSRNGYGLIAPISPAIFSWEGGAFDEAHPDSFKAYRACYFWGGGCDIMEGFNELTVEDMPAQAAYHWPILKSIIDQVERDHSIKIDAVTLTNETGGNEPSELAKVIAYEYEMGKLMHADGYRGLFGNLGTNSPDWDLWVEFYVPHAIKMWDLGHIYNRHVYADRVDGKDYLVKDGMAAGQSSDRIFKEVNFLRGLERGCGPVVLGELGFVTFPGVTHFVQQVTAFNELLQGYPEVFATALFTEGDWNSGKANIQDANDELANWAKDQWLDIPWRFIYGPPIDPPPPTDSERYAIQPAFGQNIDSRRIYYAKEGDWGNVKWLSGPGSNETEKQIWEAGMALDVVSPNFEAALQKKMAQDGYFPTGKEGRVSVSSETDPASPVLGVDVSHWQGQINWTKTKENGAKFAFVKVSDGISAQDPRRQSNVAGALAVGMEVGPYHFYRSNLDPIAQADNFVRSIPDGCNLPPVIDVEDSNSIPHDLEQRVKIFIDHVIAKTKVDFVIIYTRANFWTAYVGNSDWMRNHLLWIAHYGVESPHLPSAWSDWDFWQYSSTGDGAKFGASSAFIDLNYLNPSLSLSELRTTYDISDPNPPPAGDIDLLPFFLPSEEQNGFLFELRRQDGSQERVQVQPVRGANIFHITKGSSGRDGKSEWEELSWDANWIWRGLDTSPGGGRFYRQFEPGLQFARWCPRFMSVGQTWRGSGHYVQFYNKQDCSESQANSGPATNGITFVKKFDVWESDYGMFIQDVIELVSANGERFWFAKGLGLVQWQMGDLRSSVSEIHLPGQRPDNIREAIC